MITPPSKGQLFLAKFKPEIVNPVTNAPAPVPVGDLAKRLSVSPPQKPPPQSQRAPEPVEAQVLAGVRVRYQNSEGLGEEEEESSAEEMD